MLRASALARPQANGRKRMKLYCTSCFNQLYIFYPRFSSESLRDDVAAIVNLSPPELSFVAMSWLPGQQFKTAEGREFNPQPSWRRFFIFVQTCRSPRRLRTNPAPTGLPSHSLP